MSIIDISVALRKGMPVWPGSIDFDVQWTMSMEKGDPCNLSNMRVDMHMGTHVDAPLHFLQDGESVDMLPLELFCGPAYVADLAGAKMISEKELALAEIPAGVQRLLLKTSNSERLWKKGAFDEGFVALTLGGAEWLLERGVSMVGADYLSVQGFNESPEVHKKLLAKGVGVLEGLDLSKAKEGAYELLCLPLKVMGAEGAPARAALRPVKENR